MAAPNSTRSKIPITARVTARIRVCSCIAACPSDHTRKAAEFRKGYATSLQERPKRRRRRRD